VSATPAALREADYPVPAAAPVWAPRLRVLNSERAERDAWINARGWSGTTAHHGAAGQSSQHESTARALAPRLSTDDKAWPIERWVELLHKVHARMPNALIVLRGSQEETPMLDRIRAAVGLDAVVVAGLGLRQLFAVCEAAHSMISVETGPAHAAGCV